RAAAGAAGGSLDRLYGYEVSPVLGRKVMQGLSAGRVQSVATRLVVERERDRMRFVAADYWDLLATLEPDSFTARLTGVDGKRVAQGRDFGQEGSLRTKDAVQLSERDVRELAATLDGADFRVASVDEKPYTRRPAPQPPREAAASNVRPSPQKRRRAPKTLNENANIPHTPPPPTPLPEAPLPAARDRAGELAGADALPPPPRRYERKVKNAQEA